MGDNSNGDPMLKQAELFESLDFFKRALGPLAKLPQYLRPVRVEANVTPVHATSAVSVKRDWRAAEVQRPTVE